MYRSSRFILNCVARGQNKKHSIIWWLYSLYSRHIGLECVHLTVKNKSTIENPALGQNFYYYYYTPPSSPSRPTHHGIYLPSSREHQDGKGQEKKKYLFVSCVHDDDMKERAKVVCDFLLHPSTPSFLQSIKISSAFVMTRYFFFSSSSLIFFVVLCMLCKALYTHSKDFHPFFSSSAKSKRIFLFFFVSIVVHTNKCIWETLFLRRREIAPSVWTRRSR